jgi:hypothetical protein
MLRPVNKEGDVYVIGKNNKSLEITRQNWIPWLAVVLTLDVVAFLVRSFLWFF